MRSGYKVRWTPRAAKNYDKTIDHLSENWSEKEVENFILATKETVAQIVLYPKMYIASKRKEIRRGLIVKPTAIIYRLRPRKMEIEILDIVGTRQHPRKQRL